MKLLVNSILLFCCLTTCAQSEEELFTIYLVRHAEKDVSDQTASDPVLTSCGLERAKSLSRFFKKVDLERIYSSDYTRTLDTAKPTAAEKNLEITSYDPANLESIAKTLLNDKKDALVVGHSNTTGVLAGLLCDQEIGAFDESIYSRIYQVVIGKKSSKLFIYHTSFSCD